MTNSTDYTSVMWA